MIVILTNRNDATADFVAQRLPRKEFVRIDTDELPSRVRVELSQNEATIVVGARSIKASDVTGLWFRRPTPIRLTGGRDAGAKRHAAAEYTSALEGFFGLIPENRWINAPGRNAVAGNKIEQLHRAQKFGLSVPRTLVTQSPAALRRFWRDCDGDLIIKPLSMGYIERDGTRRDSLIYTNRLHRSDLRRKDLITRCPSFFQERIGKQVDIRVTIVDRDVQAVELQARDNNEPRLDIRRNNMADVRYRRISLPRKVVAALLRLMKSYELRFGAIDLLYTTTGNFVFLEINPNGQWAWLDQARATDSRTPLIAALRNPDP